MIQLAGPDNPKHASPTSSRLIPALGRSWSRCWPLPSPSTTSGSSFPSIAITQRRPRPASASISSFLGRPGRSLRADDRLRQQRRAAARHERAFLDGLRHHARRCRLGALLSAAPADHLHLPGLRRPHRGRLPLLPSVRLSGLFAAAETAIAAPGITDLFCVHCGHDLTASQPPARLHAFTR